MRVSRLVTKRVSVTVVAALAATVTSLAATPASAASPGLADGGVVASTVPAKFTPNIGDGAVEALVQVGNTMVVGGSFTTVTPAAGAGSGNGRHPQLHLRFRRHHRGADQLRARRQRRGGLHRAER